jgi:cyclic pyranopterin phosphate synthase
VNDTTAATTGSAANSTTDSSTRASSPVGAALTHVEDGRPTMVDVGGKAVTARTAVAESRVQLPPAVARQLREAGYATAKGPVFHTAIVAGTMAAKRTHDLIPFCHPLGLEKCRITIEPDGDAIVIRCEVGVHHRTGVEMEALTGASVAALTIYDMCKALSHDLVIGPTRLVAKRGGKSDYDDAGADASSAGATAPHGARS